MTPQQVREMWATELESGNWQQGEGRLARETDDGFEFCCLGVACELAVRAGVIDGYDGLAPNLELYPAVAAWLGLASFDGDYLWPGGPHGVETAGSLVADNDSHVPFAEIAVTIRSEPRGLVAS